MNTFTWMIAIVLLLALLLGGNQRGNKKFIIIAVLVMFCVMGLRDANTIGNDSRTSYKWAYNGMDDMEWSDLPGWTDFEENPALPHFMKATREFLGADYQTFLAIESAIIMIAFAHLISKYSVSPIQSICYYCGLLYYIFMFSAMKQALAMSILIFAFDAIMDKKPIRFVLLVFAAALFHFPALIFLPAYWIAQIKMERSFLIMLAALFVVTFIFRDRMINLMMNAYGDEDSAISLAGVTFMGNKVIIMAVIIIAALLLRPMSNKDYLYSTLIKFVGIATVLQTFCYYNNIFERLADYYFQFSVIFIPLVFEKNEQIKSRLDSGTESLIKNAAPILFCCFGIWRFANYIVNDGHFLPYKFFFQ